MIGVGVFVASLLIGEQNRVTLLALYLPRWPFFALAVVVAFLVRWVGRNVRVMLPLQIALCLVLLFPVLGFRMGSSKQAERPIHLASYNIYFGKLNRPELIEEIARMPADVIVLQAANDSLGARLRARLPDRSIHQDKEFMLVSRMPVVEAVTPPPLPDGTPAMFMKYVIDSPNGKLRVFSVHPYSPRHALFDGKAINENIAAREAQIMAAVDAARSEVTPFVIVGDTNLPVLSSMGRRAFSGLHDAWDDVGFGVGYTFPAKRPWMRIDRALAADGVRFLDVRVGKRGNSDHLPLYADLELTTPPTP